MRNRLHDSTGHNRGNQATQKKHHRAYKKSHKVGDVGWVAYTGHDTEGNLCTRFVGTYKYSDMRFSYIKDLIYSMILAEMDFGSKKRGRR